MECSVLFGGELFFRNTRWTFCIDIVGGNRFDIAMFTTKRRTLFPWRKRNAFFCINSIWTFRFLLSKKLDIPPVTLFTREANMEEDILSAVDCCLCCSYFLKVCSLFLLIQYIIIYTAYYYILSRTRSFDSEFFLNLFFDSDVFYRWNSSRKAIYCKHSFWISM